MKRLVVFLGAIAVVAGLFAQVGTNARIPEGVVAAHLIGRVVVDADGVSQMIGYYPFIEGLTDLFAAGTQDEKTAYFSFRSDRFRLTGVTNGSLLHLRSQPVEGTTVPIRIYHNAYPNRDFSRPENFSEGQLVATFQTRGSMVTLVPPVISVTLGTADLVSSSDFEFGGRLVNLRQSGDAVTLAFNGALPPWGSPITGISVPFGGSAIATGRRQ